MTVLVTGANGLLGSLLVKKLRANGHSVKILLRKKTNLPNEFFWNPDEQLIDEAAFENIDAIIHLSGANIGKRWNKAYKKELYDSRIGTTQLLQRYCENLGIQLNSFVSASGINYYGTYTSDKILTEQDGILHQDFLSNLCKDWELAADNFDGIAERIIKIRIAPVLSKKGGSFEKLQKITNQNLAAGIGSGKQWFNWIHIEDLTDIFVDAIENPNLDGIYNAVADEIISQKELMKKLAHKKNKFFFPIHIPAFFMQLVFGEMSEIILEGTRASNQKIKSKGFSFRYPDLDSAFRDLVE